MTLCLACGADGPMSTVLSLGCQPPANLLLNAPEDSFPTYPLDLLRCPICTHGQLSHMVPSSELFSDYAYASGTSDTLGAYFDWFAEELAAAFPDAKSVLEIACNDGSLLRRLAAKHFDCTGIDPAENLVNVARSRRLNVWPGYWPDHSLAGATYDIIVAMNVLAHVEEPLAFLKAMRGALTENGVGIVQTSQANMLRNGEFDAIYHEHRSYFTPRSFECAARLAGLRVWAIRRVTVHGHSMLYFLTPAGGSRRPNISQGFRSPPFGKSYIEIGDSTDHYPAFSDRARTRISEVTRKIDIYQKSGHHVAFVGAAAKAVVFLHASKIRPHSVCDEAPLKIGKWIPDTNLPIWPLTALGDVMRPALVVLSAWNYREELSRKVRAIRPHARTEFLTYFPTMEVFQ